MHLCLCFSFIIESFIAVLLSVSGLNQVVSEQAVDGPSPLDTMIQRLQQEQDQRLGTNETSASATTAASIRATRGMTKTDKTVGSHTVLAWTFFFIVGPMSCNLLFIQITALLPLKTEAHSIVKMNTTVYKIHIY